MGDEMIDQLLTDQQAHEIVEIIKIQCMHFQSFMKKGDSIFYGPYTQMRQKYSATSAVISGFAPGRFQIEGITSRNLYYGLMGWFSLNYLVKTEYFIFIVVDQASMGNP